jgi:hypothetical protein
VFTVLGSAAAAPKDLCVRDTDRLNTFVFRTVEQLKPGGAISVQGIWRVGTRVLPFHGGAVIASDGTVRLGLFVHSTADGGSNDFTLSGETDTLFAGTLSFDNDGDFRPNGTLTLESLDCATVTIP